MTAVVQWQHQRCSELGRPLVRDVRSGGDVVPLVKALHANR